MPQQFPIDALRIDEHGCLAGLAQGSAAPIELWVEGACIRFIHPSPLTGAFATPIDWPAREVLGQTFLLRRAGEAGTIAICHLDRLSPEACWYLIVSGETGRFAGGMDQFAGTTLIGWAHDRLAPGRPVVVDIRVDGRHVRSTVADRTRPNPTTGGYSRDGFVVTLDRYKGVVLVEITVAADEKAFFSGTFDLDGDSSSRQSNSYQRWLGAHDVSGPDALRRARLFARTRISDAAIIVVPPSRVSDCDGGAAAWHRTWRSIDAQVLAPAHVLRAECPASADAATAIACETWQEAIERAGDCRSVLVVEAGDELAPAALLLLQEALDASPDAPFAFADEDHVSSHGGLRRSPVFKTAWDAELARAQPFQFRPALARTSLLPRDPVAAAADHIGWLRDIVDWSSTPPTHVPFVLLHRHGITDAGTGTSSTPERITVAQPRTWPLVSVVVPTRDMLPLLAQCVEGVLYETDYPAVELIIADNDSAEPETTHFLDRIRHDPRVRIVPFAGPFDYSAINNLAVSRSTGELVALLNNDIKVIGADWLKLMVQQALRPDVGAVGARLLYDDGLIQHAGIALGIGGVASHLHKREPGNTAGVNGRLRHVHQVSAVTAACLLVRRALWNEVGGLSADFPIAFNDVDFCLKLQARGYRNLMQPAACLYHLESASRGREDTPEKKARFAADKQRMLDRWGTLIQNDPFVSPNWSLASTSIVPAFPPRHLPVFARSVQAEAISRQ